MRGDVERWPLPAPPDHTRRRERMHQSVGVGLVQVGVRKAMCRRERLIRRREAAGVPVVNTVQHDIEHVSRLGKIDHGGEFVGYGGWG